MTTQWDGRAEAAPDDGAWADTPLWAAADHVPGVECLPDPGGAEADRYGAETSGAAVLVDATGRVRFAGGLTPGRGHEGDSPGGLALRSLLTHGNDATPAGPAVLPRTAAVFGCGLGGATR